MIKNAYLIIVPLALIGLCFHFCQEANRYKSELHESYQKLEIVSQLVVDQVINQHRISRNVYWNIHQFDMALAYQHKIDYIDSLRREGHTNYYLINHPSFLAIEDTASFKLPSTGQGNSIPIEETNDGTIRIIPQGN